MEKREIELIPREIEEAEREKKGLRAVRLIGFGVLGLSILAVALLSSVVGGQMLLAKNLQGKISEKEAKIDELAATEEKVTALADKSGALTQIFRERRYYSILFEALAGSIPMGIEVTGVSAEAAKTVVGLSGETQSYLDLAKFLENLVDPALGGSVFAEVALTSVTFDPNKGVAQFAAEVTVLEASLEKGWEGILR